MTAVIPLGRFDQVRLRDAWPSEDGHFTPWLAQPDNLKLLGEALGLGELQDQQTEVRVGDFLIDILAVDSEGDMVVIENQLEQTDHKHLGQLLTYLAGQERKATLVWIAETFRAEHRAVIDWLNRNTADEFEFFAVELELWRIGDSPPAPRFRLIAYPNALTQNIRAATREAADPELAERHRIRLAYWQSFGEFLRAKKSTFNIRRSVKTSGYRFPPELPGFRIIVRISTRHQRASVGLAISRDPDRVRYRALLTQKVAIEAEFGEPLSWEEKPGIKRPVIYITRAPVDLSDSSQYADLHAWMLDKMERLRSTFGVRIRALPPVESEDDETDE